jgi:hypothetical protein
MSHLQFIVLVWEAYSKVSSTVVLPRSGELTCLVVCDRLSAPPLARCADVAISILDTLRPDWDT